LDKLKGLTNNCNQRKPLSKIADQSKEPDLFSEDWDNAKTLNSSYIKSDESMDDAIRNHHMSSSCTINEIWSMSEFKRAMKILIHRKREHYQNIKNAKRKDHVKRTFNSYEKIRILEKAEEARSILFNATTV
jgi:hypothetical protein